MDVEEQSDIEPIDEELTSSRDNLPVMDIYDQKQETEFFKPNLEPYKRPRFISPKVTPQLIDTIRKNRLLILGGSNDIDNSSLIRHLASRLSEELSSNEDRLLVLEWNHSSPDLLNVEIKLRETIIPTIFILPGITPEDIKYDLSIIKKMVNSNQHFILISTDAPYSSWKLPGDDQHFWQDLPSDLYSVDDLTNILIQGLDESRKSLPKGILGDFLEPEMDGLSFRRVAEDLKTPVNISIFIKLLCAEKSTPTLQLINDLVEVANDKTRTFELWYPALEDREQLIALGLSFFDGLYDDQFFAAIEKVIENAWKRRDPSLSSLDYCDLDKLKTFFNLVDIDGYLARITSRVPGQRFILFKVAWDSNRRQILAALPIMANLVMDSVLARSRNFELYRTQERRRNLRRVIGDSISDIGLISVEAVKRTMLQLASDKDPGVQAVAARAMARWRQHGKEAELFKLLYELRENSEEYVQAIIALTISYASRYDSQNELNTELCTLLSGLARDRRPLVRDVLCNRALPNIIPRHLRQLREAMHDMIYDKDLIPEIAKNLALAYRYNGEDVKKTLKIWDQECKALRSSQGASTEITLRDKLLATIALTYGGIKYEDEATAINADEYFTYLLNILSEKNHPFVTDNAVIAIGHQARANFEKIEPYLKDHVSDVAENQRDRIVEILKDIYLVQRRDLKFSSYPIEVNGVIYPVGIDSERPLTTVETAMLQWIKTPNNPAPQQVATRAFIAFSKALDQKEAEEILKIRELRDQYESIKESDPIKTVSIDKLNNKNKIEEIMALWLAKLRDVRYRAIIEGLLPEIFKQNKSNSQQMAFVMNKWRLVDDNDIRSLVKLQDFAMSIINNFKFIGAVLIGVTILAFIIAIENIKLLLLLSAIFIALALYKTRYSKAMKQKHLSLESIKNNMHSFLRHCQAFINLFR
jgi:hypothetical protein